MLLFGASRIYADPLSCVEEHYLDENVTVQNKSTHDAQQLVEEILSSIAIKRPIKAIPCSWAKSASAWQAEEGEFQGVPAGEYVVFNPTYVKNVIGAERALAIALFAHEVAHLLNADLTIRRSVPTKQRESDADFFAGCIVARFEYSAQELKSLIDRVRSNEDDLYPDQLESSSLVRDGYNQCSRYVRREGIDPDKTTSIAESAIRLFGEKKHESLYKEFLSDWSQDNYSLAALEKIGRDFDEVYGFGEVLSIKRVGFSTLSDPPRYPPGSYASVVFSIKTSKNDFLGQVTVGWQDREWKVYEYSFTPN